MPVKTNWFTLSKTPKWFSLTVAFWAQLASVVDVVIEFDDR
jgi:hypothetical protein